jgi:hypothetical protein
LGGWHIGPGRDGFYGFFCRAAFARYGLVVAWHSCHTGTNRALAKKGANGDLLTRNGVYGAVRFCAMLVTWSFGFYPLDRSECENKEKEKNICGIAI